MFLGYKGAGCLVFYYDPKTHKVSILLGKRTTGAGAGEWSIPGGGWELNDGRTSTGEINYRKTAMRELREEVGIILPKNYNMIRIWGAHYMIFDFEVFAVRLASKAYIRKWSEFRKVGWFDIDKLPKNTYWLVSHQIICLLGMMKKRGYILD